MGTTYSNCQVRADSQEAVIAALTGLLKAPAYVAPAVNGWVGVYPEAKRTDPDNLAKKLSAKLSCGVFFWSVYDSDIFFYTLYENGKKRDEFNSNPDCFESVSTATKARLRGKPEALITYCLPGIGYSRVLEVLHPAQASEVAKELITFSPMSNDQYLFADSQASALAELMGINETLAALGYKDIRTEQAGDYNLGDFSLVTAGVTKVEPQPSAKKSASSKASARLGQRDDWGVPALVTAAWLCRPDFLRGWLDGGYDVNLAVDTSSLRLQQKNSSPALANQLESIVHQRFGNFYEDGMTALMVAAGASGERAVQQQEAVRVLLDAGADVNARSETGRTALGEALQQGAEQIVEVLRAAGAME